MFSIVCTGSRSWSTPNLIVTTLSDLIFPAAYYKHVGKVRVIQGQSPGGGADLYVQKFMESVQETHGPMIESISCPMDSSIDHVEGARYGASYLRRNIRMLETYNPDLVVAFRAEGKSNGTDHTVREAAKRKIPTLTVFEWILLVTLCALT